MRIAFVMSVNAGAEEDYTRRHNPISPELEGVLRSHGVKRYSIFLHRKTRQLFAYAEVASEAQWAAIARTPECQRWWHHMADLMPHNQDFSPVAEAMEEVFHLD